MTVKYLSTTLFLGLIFATSVLASEGAPSTPGQKTLDFDRSIVERHIGAGNRLVEQVLYLEERTHAILESGSIETSLPGFCLKGELKDDCETRLKQLTTLQLAKMRQQMIANKDQIARLSGDRESLGEFKALGDGSSVPSQLVGQEPELPNLDELNSVFKSMKSKDPTGMAAMKRYSDWVNSIAAKPKKEDFVKFKYEVDSSDSSSSRRIVIDRDQNGNSMLDVKAFEQATELWQKNLAAFKDYKETMGADKNLLSKMLKQSRLELNEKNNASEVDTLGSARRLIFDTANKAGTKKASVAIKDDKKSGGVSPLPQPSSVPQQSNLVWAKKKTEEAKLDKQGNQVNVYMTPESFDDVMKGFGAEPSKSP